MASSARSSACAPPAWNAITKAWPVVNCTALASSKMLLVDPVQDLGADPDPGLRAGVAPGRDGRLGGGEQHVDVGVRVPDAELDPERAGLGGHPVRRAGLVEREVGAERAWKAAAPSAAAVSPYTLGLGDSG